MYPNPSYLELLNRETIRARMEQAENQRLIRVATLASPSGTRKLWLIFRVRWAAFWKGERDSKSYRPISAVPGKSNI